MSEILLRYLQTRILVPRVVALLSFLFLLVLTASVIGASGVGGTWRLGSALVLLAALTIQFRLWDDIADRDYDRIHQPDRVVPQAQSLFPFLATTAALAALVFVVLLATRSSFHLLAYFSLLGVFLFLYRNESWFDLHRDARTVVVLLKYPIIFYLATFDASPHILIPLGLFAYCVPLLFDFSPRVLGLHSDLKPPASLLSKDFEEMPCYLCGGRASQPFMQAEDDLTGKPGRFTFCSCSSCGLVYQNPRLRISKIKDFYDEDYIAHRKKTNWGILTPFYENAMGKLDRDKAKMVDAFLQLDESSRVLDIGCGAGTFLEELRTRYGARGCGIDFKDLSRLPAFVRNEFRCGVFTELPFVDERYDLITMWHFLEHDYDPLASLVKARDLLRENGRLLVEVPRLDSQSFRLFRHRWPGLQAPQHTAMYSKQTLIALLEKAGWEIEQYHPYGAFPAYFYFFSGAAFHVLQGKGLNLQRAVVPYFLGQLLTWPFFAFERHLNLAMQTVVAKPRR